MAIHSTTFGAVTLTDEDAKAFNRQVTYGRPKKAASATIERGVELAEAFQASGRKLILKPLPRTPND
jgi:hypothetical protein